MEYGYKPCPFCGGPAKREVIDKKEVVFLKICCVACGAGTKVVTVDIFDEGDIAYAVKKCEKAWEMRINE